jgi:hypothetical protein
MDDRSQDELEARRTGRRILIVAYYVTLVSFIAVAAGNVLWQLWAPVLASHPKVDCRAGLYDLGMAIDRARSAAQAASQQGEDTAVAQFRSALEPEWSRNAAIAASCNADTNLATALDAIERLRYAEERAVRREVNDLAPLRRKVQALMGRELSPAR